MNRDAILNMPAGREMDALIAERVMGQIDFSHPDIVYLEGATEDGQDGWSGYYCPRCGAGETAAVPEVKCTRHYSTDIAAAFAILDKLLSAGLNWQVSTADMAGLQERYYCTITDFRAFRNYGAFADTAPLAICRAALLAVGCSHDRD